MSRQLSAVPLSVGFAFTMLRMAKMKNNMDWTLGSNLEGLLDRWQGKPADLPYATPFPWERAKMLNNVLRPDDELLTEMADYNAFELFFDDEWNVAIAFTSDEDAVHFRLKQV